MHDKLPFDAYDFFAYLASGSILLAAIAVGVPGSLAFADGLVAQAALGIVASYVLGHAAAQLSSSLLEKGLVRIALAHPVRLLLKQDRPGPWRHFFREYSRPLPSFAVEAALKRLAEDKVDAKDPEAVMTAATYLLHRDTESALRADKFLRLYGFSRNATVACLAISTVLLAGASEPRELRLGLVGIAVAYILWLRYLKFYRLYVREAVLLLK